MKYKYEAHDKFARPHIGFIEAATEADACAAIRDELKLFALKVEPDDDGQPIKTVLPGHQNAQSKSAPSPLTGTKVVTDDLELELFGNPEPAPPPATQAVQEAHQAVETINKIAEGVRTAAAAAPVDSKLLAQPWETQLQGDIEQVAFVLRTLKGWEAEYKRASAEQKPPQFGPNVGGQTWSLVDKNFDAIAYEMMKDVLLRAARSR